MIRVSDMTFLCRLDSVTLIGVLLVSIHGIGLDLLLQDALKSTPPVSILHQASDWVLLVDLHGNHSLPNHIAFTQLRPDITIFSNALRKVILIELTCPCEKNMESWHSTKINKYLTLKTTL